ncbi:MAG TPA: nitrilase-related carbon-nitrogen hydrolase [Phycisphaerae bacterium]|nr:nitrilase-related carbon-nitrogen hydrolase [Phycisphaerae bacterium]
MGQTAAAGRRVFSSAVQGPRLTAMVWALAAVGSFHAAYAMPAFFPLMVIFAAGTAGAAWIDSARGAFWLGLGIGFAIYAPHLFFFARIFHFFAISLWLILAVWVGFFVLLAHYARRRFPRWASLVIFPILWMGLEYFRSELYPLRFAWLTPGLAFPPEGAAGVVGVYGIGGLLMLLATGALLVGRAWRFPALAAAVAIVGCAPLLDRGGEGGRAGAGRTGPLIVGIQSAAVPGCLDRALAAYPNADLFILSEYSFQTPPPSAVRAWCAAHQKYLLAGGIRYLDPGPGVPRDAFRDTAFVVGPDGSLVFEQAKSVPIQFMSDGLPAAGQQLWHSPWGDIGVCICYDLSYTRVTDRLVKLGATMLIVPAMDVTSWGLHEHQLHARIGPMRAAEYGIPVVRVCSSGISQIIDRSGQVTASAPFPGPGAMLAGRVAMGATGRLPADRVAARWCAWAAIGDGVVELSLAARRRVADSRMGRRKALAVTPG